MKIGRFSKMTGLTSSALRYYDAQGLLPKLGRLGGRRDFNPEMVDTVYLIRLAQRAGFRISEIRTLISGFGKGSSPSERWKSLARSKIKEAEELMEVAQDMKRILLLGLDGDCLRIQDCHLIEAEKSSPRANAPRPRSTR